MAKLKRGSLAPEDPDDEPSLNKQPGDIPSYSVDDLRQAAVDLLDSSRRWEPTARLVGNVQAIEIAMVAELAITFLHPGCYWCGIETDCDCHSRALCRKAGQDGHRTCGYCSKHHVPRFNCGCVLEASGQAPRQPADTENQHEVVGPSFAYESSLTGKDSTSMLDDITKVVSNMSNEVLHTASPNASKQWIADAIAKAVSEVICAMVTIDVVSNDVKKGKSHG